MNEPALMDLGHGGGCGCKLDPAVLRGLLNQDPAVHKNLLVGYSSSDDAAAWKLDDGSCIVATTDFFLPVVNDPHDFGAIAATNAISDVYAMGARPIFALALLGMPIAKLSRETIAKIIAGGESTCSRAGIPVAGGHSIDAAEPIYGLVAVGRCAEKHLMRNTTARVGDAIVLGKPLGVGILSNALKAGRLDEAGYRELLDTTTRLNAVGPDLAEAGLVSALTDVTGFGVLGHLLEMCKGSSMRASISMGDIPLLPAAQALAQAGLATGASARNWQAYGEQVSIAGELDAWHQTMLTDPQTSGGLLASCAHDDAAEVLEIFAASGFDHARIIGSLSEGEIGIDVRA